jgi:dihydroorotase-like cyclic amidohydrolase
LRDAGDLDTLIEHAWVVRSSGFFRGDVGIRDGRIAWIRSEGGEMRSAAARNIIPADGLYLIPGLIESHLHTRGSTRGR